MTLGERAVHGGRLVVTRDADELVRLAARRFRDAASAAVRERGGFMVALAGGSTPRALYTELAGAPSSSASEPTVDWAGTHIFWGDERCVPPDHPDSNYRMAFETLLKHVPIPPEHVHRMRGEKSDPELAAAQYESELRDVLGAPAPRVPRFDLMLLGLGTDAHTASLFPGSPVLAERERLVAAPFVEKLGGRRITLTPPVINAARQVVFLVSGRDKAAALKDVLESEVRPDLRPAQCVRPESGTLLWLVDAEAASLLSP